MKKIKKIVFIIWTFSVLILNLNVVKAVKKKENITFGCYGSCNDLNNGVNHFEAHNYYGITSTGKNLKLYCIDMKRPHDSSGSKVTVTDVIDFEAPYSITQAKYFGLATIIQKGAHSVSADSRRILETDMAVRAYTNFILGNTKSEVLPFLDTNWYSGSMFTLLGHDIANESAYKNNLKNLLNLDMNFGSNYRINVTGSTSSANSAISNAKTLIRQGYQAAIDFAKNKGLSSKVDVTTVITNDNTDNSSVNKQDIIVSFRITQTNEKNPGYVKIKKSDIVCNNCNKYGVNISNVQYLDNGSWKNLNSEIDLAKFVDKNKYAKIKITLNKVQTDEEECGASITLNYRIPGQLNIQLFTVNKNASYYQRYVGAEEVGIDSNGDSDSVTKKVEIPANKIGCLTTPCETEVSTPYCTDKDDNKNVAHITAPTNIKKCIIGKIDDAGNSYKALNSGVNNNYCSTYCKEDYQKIELNRALSDLKCGSYFKLRAHIEGSQDCYSAGGAGVSSINREQFVADMLVAQMNLIESYNNYKKAEVALAELEKLKANSNGISSFKVSGTYQAQVIDQNSVNENNGTIGKMNNTSEKFEYEANTLEELEKQINEDFEQASNDLDPKAVEGTYREFQNIIAEYNSCVTELDSDFAFQQKVAWEYTEYTSENYVNGNLVGNTTINDLIPEEDRVLSPVGEKKTTKEIMACTGEVTDAEYNNCSTGWVNPNNTFSSYSYIICDINGCRNSDQIRLSNAKYVKLHMTASLDYESKNSFNQVSGSGPISGAITSNGSYNNFYAPGIQTTPIEGLPLSLDSAGGGIFKLKIRDLGEFYDQNEKYGRLIDFGDTEEKNSVAYVRGVSEVWNGEYVCYYKNNCQIPECPDCDFECETEDGGKCEWRDCPDCDTTCVNCIFNLGKLQLSNKTVSTNNFNSADREYGYNWNINTNLEELELIRDKADETIKEIEDAGTTIYDEGTDKDSKLEFEITLTPNITNHIKDYNKSVEASGGYGNDSLTCYNYQDVDNVVHQNMFCYSDFIDELVEQYKDSVYVKESRGTADSRATNGLLNNYDYWTPWTKEYDNPGIIGGPAWK